LDDVAYGYDADGHLTTVESAAGGFRETYTYNPAGQMTGVASQTKDAQGAWQAATGYALTRDVVGNPTAVTITRGGGTETRSYRYDDADRLTAVCYGSAVCTIGAADETYVYDADGNLTQSSVDGSTMVFTVDEAGQVDTADDGGTVRSFSYDAAGNLLSDGISTFAYGLDGAIRSRSTAGTITSYGTDAAGLRRTATTGGSITGYAWDENAAVPQLTGIDSGSVTSSLLRAPSGLAIAATTGAASRWLGHDWLGSITDEYATNAGAPTRAAAVDYTGYGAPRAPVGATPGTAIAGVGFTGSLDGGAGWWHLMARDYQPATARFGALDPLGDGYRYVSGRPTVLIDPEGLCGWDPWDASGAGNCFDGLARTLSGRNNANPLAALVAYQTNTSINQIRGAFGGLTDLIADSLVADASCTIDSTSITARAAQVSGLVGVTLIPGLRELRTVAAGSRLATGDLAQELMRRGTTQSTRAAAESESRDTGLPRLSPEDTWGNPTTLARHYRDHGADFGARSAEDYANQAYEFLQRSQHEGLPTKIDGDGVIRVYDPGTNTFGAYNPDGTTRTFFTPKSGVDYWERQPGSPPWIRP
jgi:RHS repeat-associated protein